MPSLVTPQEYEILLFGGAVCVIGAFIYWALFKR